MAKQFLVSLNLNKNELQNAVIQNLASAPANPLEGQVYFNTATHKFNVYENGAWVTYTTPVELASALANYYDKATIDQMIADAIAGGKIDLSGYAKTADVNAALELKADKSDTYTKQEVDDKIAEKDSLPTQADNSGKFLTTNGTTASWETIQASDDEFTTGTSTTKVTTVKQVKDLVSSVQTTLQGNIDGKVAKSDYESDKTQLDERLDGIDTTLSGKVDQSTYDSDKQASDGLIAGKVDQSAYDAKMQEIDGKLANVYTKSETYTKTEVDNALADKADSNTVNEALELKADKSYVDEELGKKADSATTLAGYGITDAYTKEEVDAKVASVYKFKGTVATEADLPTEGNTEGDVYNVTETGENFAWVAPSGDVAGFWDDIGGDVDLTSYLTKDEASTIYETISNVSALKEELLGAIDTAKNEAIASANLAAHKEVYANGELTPSGGVATWTITHTLGTDVTVLVKEVATGEEVVTDVLESNNTVTIRMNTTDVISAGTYKAVIIG